MNYIVPFVTIAAVACVSPATAAQESKLSFAEALELYSALIENATQGLKLIQNEEAANIIAGEVDKLTAAAEKLNGVTAQMDVTEQDLITAKTQLDKAQNVAIKFAEEIQRLLDNKLVFPKIEASLNQFITASGALELLESADDEDFEDEEQAGGEEGEEVVEEAEAVNDAEGGEDTSVAVDTDGDEEESDAEEIDEVAEE